MKVHKKCEDTFWSIVEQKNLALLSYKEWRKNHCYGVIMITPFPHTCTPWSECMLFFSMDPLFDLAIYAMQVCFTLILPKLHISLLEVGSKAKHQCLGEDTYTIERFESTIWWEVSAKFSIAKVIKKLQVCFIGDSDDLVSKLLYFSTAQGNMVDT